MVIDESGLARAMKAAHKCGGYTVTMLGDPMPGMNGWVAILAPGWMVMLSIRKIPKKILGLIVEHLGALPEEGKAYEIRKKAVQEIIAGVAIDPLVKLESIAENGKQERVRNTRIEYKGVSLWQCADTLRILPFDPDRLEVCRWDVMVPSAVGDAMYLKGTESKAFILPDLSLPENEKQAIQHLEQFQWINMD